MKIQLRVRTSPTEAFEWEHAGPRFRIGRADDCQLVVRGEAGQLVSGRHAQIELSPQGAVVTDLQSTNGTYVNGQRLSGPTRLAVGDQVQLGQAGARLEVVGIDLASPASAVDAAVGPGNQPSMSPGSQRSGTQMLLVQMQRQNQRSFVVMASLGLVGVMIAAGVIVTRKTDKASAITGANATTLIVGAPGSFTVRATGFPTPTLSEMGTLPAGVSFGDGVLGGTPAAGTGGAYPITFTARNGIGNDATQSFTLTVDQPPAIICPAAATFTAGTASRLTITATGFPIPSLSREGNLPGGVSFSDGVLSGTPNTGAPGTYPITFSARNGVGHDAAQNLVLTVMHKPIEDVVRPFEPAIVWIGYELKDKQFVYASGWALKRNVVVTTAAVAADLGIILEKSKGGMFGEVTFVVHHAHGSVPINELRTHPKYDARHPEANASIAHNVAVALLGADLPTTCALASREEQHEINVNSPYLVLGYIDHAEPGEPFDKAKDAVRRESRTVSVTSSDPAGADTGLSYRLKVAGASTLSGADEDLAGAPIFNERGNVVGTMSVMASSIRMAGGQDVHEWLAQGR